LDIVGERLSQLTDWEVFLPDDCLSDSAKRVIGDLRSGQVCLLENLRWHAGEVDNDEQFARGLKEWCDIYVNDALACSHEHHASLVALPRLVPQRAAGLLLHKELTALARLTLFAEHPALAILGGSATTRRLDLLETLLTHVDSVCVGGGLSMTLLRASGKHLGQTPVSEDLLPRCRSLLDQHHGRIWLPADAICSGPGHLTGNTLDIDKIPASDHTLDVGSETIAAYGKLIADAKTIVYTGLMSVVTRDDSEAGTLAVLGHVARAKGFSIVTGNESALTLKRGGSELTDQIDHMSLGADATLAFIAGNKLPAIDALRGASNE
jgi:phosphoglycerate kinase